MNDTRAGRDAAMLERFITWGQLRDDVRALILTSSLTCPGAPVDAFSDYDLIVVVRDIRPYFPDDWLEDFGRVLVLYRDPVRKEHGFDKFARITQYEDGLKIDFTLWNVGTLRAVVEQASLSQDFDLGYRVLLDKDGLTASLPAPTHRAYIPVPPTAQEYFDLIEEFFHEGTYLAKYLWRDDLMPAKMHLDALMKAKHMRRMLEWLVACESSCSIKLGAYGRGLGKKVRRELWHALAATYVGADPSENWQAFYGLVDLMGQVGREVAGYLGFTYPEDLHARCLAYFKNVQMLDRSAAVVDFRSVKG